MANKHPSRTNGNPRVKASGTSKHRIVSYVSRTFVWYLIVMQYAIIYLLKIVVIWCLRSRELRIKEVHGYIYQNMTLVLIDCGDLFEIDLWFFFCAILQKN